MSDTGEKACDITTLETGDIIHYLTQSGGDFIIEKGSLREDGIYRSGVMVKNEDTEQFVSTWFIVKVERAGDSIYVSKEVMETNE